MSMTTPRFFKNFVSMPRPWPWRGHGHQCPFSPWPCPPNSDGKHNWSPLLLTWQAYLVRNKSDMASMFSPLYNQYGKHIWSLSWSKWQPYLVHPYTVLVLTLMNKTLIVSFNSLKGFNKYLKFEKFSVHWDETNFSINSKLWAVLISDFITGYTGV